MDVVVIGAGVSGLTAAYVLEREAARRGLAVSVSVLEAAPRTGGKICTQARDGFLVEEAAAGWLASNPAAGELCAQLGLSSEIVPASSTAARRYIVRGGRMRELKAHPLRFLTSDVLTLSGRLRLGLEPVARPAASQDETVRAFAARRLGREAADYLIDAVASGVFAGDPARLSLAAAFPKMAALEREHGSLIRGFVRSSKTVRARAGGATLLSLRGGLSTLTTALASALTQPPRLGAPVTRVEQRPGGWSVHLADGTSRVCERVLLAVPAHAAAELVAGQSAALAHELTAIPYAPVAVVALGFRESELPAPLNGFGFLVPSLERRNVLGTLWESSVFSGRAPEGHVLTRTMVGGARRPELVGLDERTLVELVRGELRSVMELEARPVFVHVKRHPQAIAQYVVGHRQRVASIEAATAELPGLQLVGSPYRGVSLGECIVDATKAAHALLDAAPA